MPLPKIPMPKPIQGFRFLVTFAGLPGKFPPVFDMQFQEVSGLSVRAEFESVKEAGRFGDMQLPTGRSFGDVTLKRALAPTSGLSNWVRNSIMNLDYSPVQVVIVLLGPLKQAVATWELMNAIPVSWEMGSLDANSSQVLIESLTLKYESFTFTPLAPNVG